MENRTNERYQVLKAGTISTERAIIDCAVHDLSIAGANLEVDSQLAVPDSFDLLMDAQIGKQRCRVVWRKGARIGISFS
jgi:PilZ domain